MHWWFYLGPYMFWIFIAVIVIAGMFFGYLRSASRDKTIRELAERGQPIPPEIFQRSPGSGSRSGLLIGGLVMLFIGIGLSLMIWHMPAPNHDSLFVGAIPGGIGVALILSYIFLGRDKSGY